MMFFSQLYATTPAELCVEWISLPRVAPDGLLPGVIHICLLRRPIPKFIQPLIQYLYFSIQKNICNIATS